MIKERAFCETCGVNTSFRLEEKTVKRITRHGEGGYQIHVAKCSVCGDIVAPEGLLEQNVKDVARQEYLETRNFFERLLDDIEEKRHKYA